MPNLLLFSGSFGFPKFDTKGLVEITLKMRQAIFENATACFLYLNRVYAFQTVVLHFAFVVRMFLSFPRNC